MYESLKKLNEIDREKLKELFDSVDINKNFKIDLVQFQRMLFTIFDRPDDFILNGYNKYLPLRLILLQLIEFLHQRNNLYDFDFRFNNVNPKKVLMKLEKIKLVIELDEFYGLV